MTRVEKLIAHHEGFRSKIYTDTTGNRTIGYGLNLEHMSEERAQAFLKFEVNRIREELPYRITSFNSLSGSRQDVLIDMAYNLGIEGLMKFRKFLSAVNEGNFNRASYEMQNSLWARQVGRRAETLAKMMVVG